MPTTSVQIAIRTHRRLISMLWPSEGHYRTRTRLAKTTISRQSGSSGRHWYTRRCCCRRRLQVTDCGIGLRCTAATRWHGEGQSQGSFRSIDSGGLYKYAGCSEKLCRLKYLSVHSCDNSWLLLTLQLSLVRKLVAQFHLNPWFHEFCQRHLHRWFYCAAQHLLALR